MTRFATDIVDVYVFRRLNARVQFLLLQRRNDVPMAQTWQAFHHQIEDGQSAPEAARHALHSLAGLQIERFYTADFINQFYDEARDAVVLAPVLAVTIPAQAQPTLSDELQDFGWFDRDEATARLPFSGQRWAVRHIDEIMGIGEAEAELYRFEPEDVPVPDETDIAATEPEPQQADAAAEFPEPESQDLGLEPPPEPSEPGEPDSQASINDEAETQSSSPAPPRQE